MTGVASETIRIPKTGVITTLPGRMRDDPNTGTHAVKRFQDAADLRFV